jgi:hypothetical protein
VTFDPPLTDLSVTIQVNLTCVATSSNIVTTPSTTVVLNTTTIAVLMPDMDVPFGVCQLRVFVQPTASLDTHSYSTTVIYSGRSALMALSKVNTTVLVSTITPSWLSLFSSAIVSMAPSNTLRPETTGFLAKVSLAIQALSTFTEDELVTVTSFLVANGKRQVIRVG